MGTFFPKQTSFAQLLVTSSELLVHSLCFGFVLIIYWPDSLHSFSKVYVLLTRFHLFGGRDHVPQNLVCLITKKKRLFGVRWDNVVFLCCLMSFHHCLILQITCEYFVISKVLSVF